jgi:predicted MFS family arabinose efflux permease
LFVGVALALIGVSIVVGGLILGSFALVCSGFLVYGLHQSFMQFLRFMAMEAVSSEQSARALSWVLVGGIPAAILGPLVGLWGKGLLSAAFAGSYLLLLGVLILQGALVFTLPADRGMGAVGGDSEKRPWGERLANPGLWLAVTAASFSFGLMVMLMAASPVAMHEHGHPIEASTLALQIHVLGMYVPSFFSGALVKAWGPRRLIGVGLALFAVELAVALSGTELIPFMVALALLGVAWNFLYVGGTSLLVTTYRPAEKAGVQAFNDSFVYLFATASTFGAGAWVRGLGWSGLELLTVPFLLVVAGLLVAGRLAARTQSSV